ncbi:NAD-dependent protein deacylase [Clostridium frigidicarnis]|nr:NAD-dependent protein deacylase [Clostridium frigidicarnis]
MISMDKLKDVINSSNYIVFLGGAGVSTESNIPDFRSASGLYNEKTKSKYAPEEILSHTFFFNNTEDFYKFYKDKMIYKDAKPNDAHLSLAELEKRGKLKAIITQNIDNLHQEAGSKSVLELHGSVYRNHCIDCNTFYDLDYVLNSTTLVPHCSKCNGLIKPDVVLYEESLDESVLTSAIEHISKADTLIVGGTSLTVYPAAGLLRYFSGKNLILINKSSTKFDHFANIVINDSIGKTLKYAISDN